MKEVLFIPSLAVAGAETMVQDLLIGLKKHGEKPLVVCFYYVESSIVEKLRLNEVPIIIIEKKKGFDITLYKKIYTILKKTKPDIVHTHLNVDKYVVPVAKILGISKCIHTVHNIARKELGFYDRLCIKLFILLDWILLVGISPEIKETVCLEYKLDDNQVPMIFNGRDIGQFCKKKDYALNNETMNILHVGRFSIQKNHKVIIEGFCDFLKEKNSKLFLAGDGDLRKDIKILVGELKLDEYVQFLGIQDNIDCLMAEMDVFVLPSLYEGMPITLIEAMAVGIPIIASDVGGIPDIIKNMETGLLIKPEKGDFVNALKKIYNNESLRKELGETARKESERYNLDNMVDNYIKLYKECK